MSLTPRTPRNHLSETIGNPGSTPSAKPRKSFLPSASVPTTSITNEKSLEQLREAMRNRSNQIDSPSNELNNDSPSPSKPNQDLRRKVMRKPSSIGLGHSLSRPTTPTFRSTSTTGTRSRTPTVPTRSHTPTNPFNSSTSSRFTGAYPNYINKGDLEIGDGVSLDVLGERMEGIIRFLGQVDGKAGNFGGVELSGEWIGRGKNDGSVAGNQYFACPPLSGLFVPLAKLTPLAKASAYSPPAARPSSRSTSRTSFNKSPIRLPLSQSTTTPRPKGRASLGGSTSTPLTTRTARKSLGPTSVRPIFGGGGGTPRVPPLPNRSSTPTLGIGTPRRVSNSSSALGGGTRSVSRSSFASSITRSIEGDEDDRDLNMRKLLDGSERIGREMEVKLGEKEANLKEMEEKLRKFEEEKIEWEVKEFAIREELEVVKKSLMGGKEQIIVLANEAIEVESKAQEERNESRQKVLGLEESIKLLEENLKLGQGREEGLEEEKLRLEVEVEELSKAGFDLCELHNTELSYAKQEALELSEQLLKLESASESSSNNSNLRSSTTTLAEQIDQETILAETHHLRKKINLLEEAVVRGRDLLELEIAKSEEKRNKSLDSEKESKNEVKRLKSLISDAKYKEERMLEKIDELENSLIESQTTLENERLEIETLRSNSIPSPGKSTESSIIVNLKRERNELLMKLEESNNLILTLRSDLKSAEIEIGRLHKIRGQESVVPGEEVIGLRLILHNFEEEASKMKAENSKIILQLEEARTTRIALEATVENLMTEMTNSADSSPKRGGTAENGREVGQLKVELRTAKAEIINLVKEVTELESLLESKIFKETELEELIETQKKSLSRLGQDTRLSGRTVVDENACEMCGKSGHELQDCPDFGGAPTKKINSITRSSSKVLADEEFCDDCSEFGHALEHCPLANEMF